MPFVLRLILALLITLLAGGPAMAADAAGKKPEEARATGGTPLVIFNRTIFVFRSEFIGAPPAARASRARIAIDEVLEKGEGLVVSIKANPEGQLLLVGDRFVFAVVAGDADPANPESPEEMAGRAARRLKQVIDETHEARSLDTWLKGLGLSALATGIFGLLVWAITRVRAWLAEKLLPQAGRKAEAIRIGGTQMLDGTYVLPFLRQLLDILRWLVIALLTYEWISFILWRFPYTRAWGERLNGYLLGVAEDIFGGIVGAIPGLGVAIAIFFLARFCIGVLERFLQRAARGAPADSWLSPETMPTTRRLLSIGIWLFAFAMAFPYLPGSETEAFRGLSVLLGLMVSLGASSVVGQGAAGLILTYTRTVRQGEYVRVSDHEGTVVRMGLFTTTIRTGLGEELTIPNSLIAGTVTKNYSRAVTGRGYIVDTTVTIGYDTPWRQVEAMLVEAARRTPGILETPSPRVFQTALSDYYPEYRLVAQAVPSEPRPRAEVLSVLHANVQDVFNEHGVQIMSPHYMGDPEQAKVVPPDDWYLAPAKRKEGPPAAS